MISGMEELHLFQKPESWWYNHYIWCEMNASRYLILEHRDIAENNVLSGRCYFSKAVDLCHGELQPL
jgi:hypothetical protein